jgi:hypothetical protein
MNRRRPDVIQPSAGLFVAGMAGVLSSVAFVCAAENGAFVDVTTERHFGLGRRSEVDVRVEFYPSGKIVEREARANSTALFSEAE